VSNVPDVLRFATHLLADERSASLREPQAETPDGAYGFGLALEDVGGVDVWHHGGAYGGFRTLLALVPARDLAFVALTNGDGGGAVIREVADALLAELCGVRRREPATLALEPGELELLAGRYVSADMDAAIMVADHGLAVDSVATAPDVSRQRLPRLEARPIGSRTFAIVGGQWDGERFDFIPASGIPRFVRFDGRLVARR
jgi:CubicO group peptidase (beta-lactamase class C family)